MSTGPRRAPDDAPRRPVRSRSGGRLLASCAASRARRIHQPARGEVPLGPLLALELRSRWPDSRRSRSIHAASSSTPPGFDGWSARRGSAGCGRPHQQRQRETRLLAAGKRPDRLEDAIADKAETAEARAVSRAACRGARGEMLQRRLVDAARRPGAERNSPPAAWNCTKRPSCHPSAAAGRPSASTAWTCPDRWAQKRDAVVLVDRRSSRCSSGQSS